MATPGMCQGLKEQTFQCLVMSDDSHSGEVTAKHAVRTKSGVCRPAAVALLSCVPFYLNLIYSMSIL